jgi:hypothetical protein
MDTWILKMVRVRSVRRVTAWAAALVCLALLAFGQSRYVQNFLMGPYDLGPADLDSIRDVSEAPRYFARVSGSKAIDTGIQQITVRKRSGVETGRSVSAAYYALVVGQKLLLCKSGSGSRTTLEGELVPMPGDLERQLFNTPDMQAIRGRFYPFYLSDESFRFPGYWAIAGVLVLGFFLMKQGLPAWRHLQDPTSHPLVERVNSWGDPIGVAVAAEREAHSLRFKGGGGWAITDQFLIQSTFFTFDLLRLCDLLWAYKKVTKHSVNFIPTGKTYDALLICYGGTATVQSAEKTTDDILGFAAQRAPWAIFGFSKELEGYFNENTREFCAAVEKRRQEWTQGVGAQAQP